LWLILVALSPGERAWGIELKTRKEEGIYLGNASIAYVARVGFQEHRIPLLLVGGRNFPVYFSVRRGYPFLLVSL